MHQYQEKDAIVLKILKTLYLHQISFHYYLILNQIFGLDNIYLKRYNAPNERMKCFKVPLCNDFTLLCFTA